QQIRQRTGCRDRQGFTLEVSHGVDVRLAVDTVSEARPVAAGDLHVTTMCSSDDRRARAALVAVEFTGKQRTQRDRIALELDHLDVETLFLSEAAFRRHEDETGVALRLDDAMAPDFQFFSMTIGCEQH